MVASTLRLQSAISDTQTNRSFLIFKTPEPQPPSIQVFNVDADPSNSDSYEIIASNDPNDFMETISNCPSTQRPQIIATSLLDKSSDASPFFKVAFNKSTKKINKIVQKINSENAWYTDHQTSERSHKSNNIEPQVI